MTSSEFPKVDLHGAANAVDLMLAEASVEPTTLEVANRLFPDDEFSPLPGFLENAASHYGAAVQPIDLDDGAAAAETINGWISDATLGLVPTIVTEQVVLRQELVLVNTVYLKADWIEPFLPELTRNGRFTTGDRRVVTVPFMRDREPFPRRFVRLDGADAVELSYRSGRLAMWLIVPHDPTGLAAVEESFNSQDLSGLGVIAQQGFVDLTMPKWEQTLPPADLFEWLCPLGFCVGAPFENIAPHIMITAALHGANPARDAASETECVHRRRCFIIRERPPTGSDEPPESGHFRVFFSELWWLAPRPRALHRIGLSSRTPPLAAFPTPVQERSVASIDDSQAR